jgi:hypothetical protein
MTWRTDPLPKFIAAHGWDGGKEGHAIVINGFTWNHQTNKSTFHIINSWEQLNEFDLSVENAEGMLAYPGASSAKTESRRPTPPNGQRSHPPAGPGPDQHLGSRD